jgi:hypothetical protein
VLAELRQLAVALHVAALSREASDGNARTARPSECHCVASDRQFRACGQPGFSGGPQAVSYGIRSHSLVEGVIELDFAPAAS